MRPPGEDVALGEPPVAHHHLAGTLTRQLPSTHTSRPPGSQGVPSTTASLCL